MMMDCDGLRLALCVCGAGCPQEPAAAAAAAAARLGLSPSEELLPAPAAAPPPAVGLGPGLGTSTSSTSERVDSFAQSRAETSPAHELTVKRGSDVLFMSDRGRPIIRAARATTLPRRRADWLRGAKAP